MPTGSMKTLAKRAKTTSRCGHAAGVKRYNLTKEGFADESLKHCTQGVREEVSCGDASH